MKHISLGVSIMAIPEIINTIHAMNREKAGKGLDWRESEDSLRNNILKRQTHKERKQKKKKKKKSH